MKQSPDYSYTLDLLTRFNNAITPEGEKYFFSGGVNWLQAYEQLLFMDIKRADFSETSGSMVRSTFSLHAIGFITFLSSCIALTIIFLRRCRILVYSVDSSASMYKSDPRIDDLYQALQESRVPFGEIFHSVLSKKTLKNLWTRKRFPLYLETFSWVFDVLEMLGFLRVTKFSSEFIRLSDFSDEAERKYAETLFRRYLRRASYSEWVTNILSKILKRTSLRALFAIDDTRFSYEVVEACKRAGMKTFFIQHGHFTKYHMGWLDVFERRKPFVKPEKIFVWNEYWKDELLKLNSLFSEEEIVVAGNRASATSPKRKNSHNVPKVFIPFETDAPYKEVRSYIDLLLNMRAEVYFKLRSDSSREAQLRAYGFDPTNLPKNFHASSGISFEDIDLACGTYSTILFDAIAFGIPVLLFKTSLDYGEGMIRNGLANEIDSIKENFERGIKEEISLSKEILQERKERLDTPHLSLGETLLTEVKAQKNSVGRI